MGSIYCVVVVSSLDMIVSVSIVSYQKSRYRRKWDTHQISVRSVRVDTLKEASDCVVCILGLMSCSENPEFW